MSASLIRPLCCSPRRGAQTGAAGRHCGVAWDPPWRPCQPQGASDCVWGGPDPGRLEGRGHGCRPPPPHAATQQEPGRRSFPRDTRVGQQHRESTARDTGWRRGCPDRRPPPRGPQRSVAPGPALTEGEAGCHLDEEHGPDPGLQQQVGDGLQVKHVGLGSAWGARRGRSRRRIAHPQRPDWVLAGLRGPREAPLLSLASRTQAGTCPQQPLLPLADSSRPTPRWPLWGHRAARAVPSAPTDPAAPEFWEALGKQGDLAWLSLPQPT